MLEHTLLGTPSRRWIVRGAAATAIVLVALSGYWTIRHAWAIYKLNRGVGDTVFYDADDAPTFLHDIAVALPLTHLIDGLSSAMVTGEPLSDNLGHLAVIAVWALLGIVLAVRGFSWEARRD